MKEEKKKRKDRGGRSASRGGVRGAQMAEV